MLNGLRLPGIEVEARRDGSLLVSTGREDERIDRLLRWSLDNEGIVAKAMSPGTVELPDGVLPEKVERALRLALYPDLMCLDVDGTLVDNNLAQLATLRRTMFELAGQRMPVDEILALRRSQEWSSDEVFVTELCRRHGAEVSPAEVGRVMDLRYIGTVENPGFCQFEQLLVRPGVLARLCERFAVALVTSRNRRKLEPLLARLGLSGDAAIVCQDDVTREKPDPEGVLRAQSLTGRRYVWMLGDREEDILAGKRAGALPVGVGAARERLEAAGAAIVLRDINELEAVLPPAQAFSDGRSA